MWKSFQHKASIARGLSFSDWLLLAQAWWVLIGFSVKLRLSSLERLQKRVRVNFGNKRDPSEVLAWAQELEKLVYLASSLHLACMTCLVRACSLQWMLGRSGIPSRLCIGVNNSLPGMHAHAWVQVMGQALGEPEDIEERFKVLEPSSSQE